MLNMLFPRYEARVLVKADLVGFRRGKPTGPFKRLYICFVAITYINNTNKASLV
jgi:hypothetical protein